MMSMSGGWFFVVASEAISVGETTITLPGIGSYIALAIAAAGPAAIGWAIGAMLVVILLYDQLLFRPLVAWADRFRFEQEPGVAPPRSWVLDVLRRSRLVARHACARLDAAWRRVLDRLRRVGCPDVPRSARPARQRLRVERRRGRLSSPSLLVALARLVASSCSGCRLGEVGHVRRAGLRHPAARGGADRAGDR